MKIGISSDDKTHLTKFVIDKVIDRGHVVVLYGSFNR